MQYKVVYESNSEATNIANAAKVGDTVTVTNKSRTKILPSTGGTGNLIKEIIHIHINKLEKT